MVSNHMYKLLKSTNNLKNSVLSRSNTIEYNCFTADMTQSKPKINSVDIVITDLPYGDIVSWANEENNVQAVNRLLTNLTNCLNVHAIVAVINNKKIKTTPHNYKRIKYFKLGKRYIYIFQLLSITCKSINSNIKIIDYYGVRFKCMTPR